MNIKAFLELLLHIGDSQLVLSHRLTQWCGHAPELELDIALANISLDLLGQARTALSLAAEVEGLGRDEDKLAFFRTEREYKNLLLCEQPNGDFAQTIVRQWLMDHYHALLFTALTNSSYAPLAAFAVKSLREVKYHLRFSTAWIERLSLGTEEAHEKVQQGLNELWRFTQEFYVLTAEEKELVQQGIIPDLQQLNEKWTKVIQSELERLNLTIPNLGAYRSGAKQGLHTEHLGYVLAEMQYMQRSYPDMIW